MQEDANIYDRAMERVNNAQVAQQDERKIGDLTVREFRQLMQECFDRDRAHQANQLAAQRAADPRQGSSIANNPNNLYHSCGPFMGGMLLKPGGN